MIGTSASSISIRALSIDSPWRADSRCSTVATTAGPRDRVVEKLLPFSRR